MDIKTFLIASRDLLDEELRHKTFKAACYVMLADGRLREEEQACLQDIADGLGLDKAAVDTLLAEVNSDPATVSLASQALRVA